MALITVKHTQIDGSVHEFWLDMGLYNIQKGVMYVRDGSKIEVILNPVSEYSAIDMAINPAKRDIEANLQAELISPVKPEIKDDPAIKNSRKFR